MKKIFTTLIAFGVLVFGATANAASVTYILNDSDENSLDDGDVFAVVTIQDAGLFNFGADGVVDTADDIYVADGAIGISVMAVSGGLDLSNFGLQAFSFNYDMNVINPTTGLYVDEGDAVLDGTNIDIADINPDSWSYDLDPTKSNSVFGKFDIALVGDGTDRTDLLAFMITGVDGDTIDNYSVAFSAHIADFSTNICEATDDAGVVCTSYTSSAWFGSVENTDRGLTPPEVPIPAAVWLFGSGLLGLVAVGRRKV